MTVPQPHRSTLRGFRDSLAGLIVLIASLGLASPALAQDPGVFTDVVDVNIVNLAVTVTDADGNPVLGLKPSDFEVFENGDPVEISNFYEARAGVELFSGGYETRTADERPEPAIDAPQAQLNYLTIFIDHNHIQKKNRKRLFQQVRDFLREEAGPLDRFMLVSLTDQFEVVREFTPSAGDIVASLDGLEKEVALGTATVQSQLQLLRTIESTDLGIRTGGAFGNVANQDRLQSTFTQVQMQVEFQADRWAKMGAWSLRALGYVVGSMAGLEGRKAVLFVSEGIPMRPGLGLFHANYNRFQTIAEIMEFDQPLDPPETAASHYDLTDNFTDLLRQAEASRVVFWAVDAAGMRSSYLSQASRSLRDPDSLAVMEYKPVWDTQLDNIYEEDLRQGLLRVAEETGGGMIWGTRDFRPFFQRMRESFDHYYSIGYVADRLKDGETHKVTVRARQKGLDVRYQEQYHDKTWDQRLVDATISQVVFGIGENPLELQLERAGEPTGAGAKDRKIPVRLVVPLDKLTLLPAAEGRVGRVSLVIVTRDAAGNVSPPETIPLSLRVPDVMEDGTAPLNADSTLDVPLPEGHDTVAIGVLDRTGGLVSTTSLVVS